MSDTAIVRQCPYIDHFAVGDLDVECDLSIGHAGDHHFVPVPEVDWRDAYGYEEESGITDDALIP